MASENKVTDALLCVDDEEYVLNALKRTFHNEPYPVLLSSSGAEALEIMEREPIRVVITDQRMPGIVGTELLARIKERWPHVIRIILSAYTNVPDLLQAINEGEVYRFISKPWNDLALRRLVERAMEQSRVIEEMLVLARILEESAKADNQISFKVEYLGNIIRMELCETQHPLSSEQIAEFLKEVFNLKPGGKEMEAIGGALVQQNGKLTFVTEVGESLQLVLEFPIVEREEKNER